MAARRTSPELPPATQRDGHEHVPLRSANSTQLNATQSPSASIISAAAANESITDLPIPPYPVPVAQPPSSSPRFELHTCSSRNKLRPPSPVKKLPTGARGGRAGAANVPAAHSRLMLRTTSPSKRTASAGGASTLATMEQPSPSQRGSTGPASSTAICFRVCPWCSKGNDGAQSAKPPSDFRFSEVEQRLYYQNRAYYADAVFSADCTTEEIDTQLIPNVVHNAFLGEPAVMACYGGPATGKSTTLFGASGLLRSYIAQVLLELNRHGLTTLYTMRVSAMDIIGDEAVDVLALTRFAPKEESGPRTPYSIVVESGADVDQVVRRLSARRESARHSVVTVSVSPKVLEEGLSQLVRSLGKVCFVELNADSRAAKDDREISILRHGNRCFFNVVLALLRRRQKSSSDYVPYGDSALTMELRDVMERGGLTYVILHLASEASQVTQTTLDVAEQLVQAQYPNGLPKQDYQRVAVSMWERLVGVQQQYSTDRKTWELERAQLEHDKFLLQKAYDACSIRTEGSVSAPVAKLQGHESVETDGEKEPVVATAQRQEERPVRSSAEASVALDPRRVWPLLMWHETLVKVLEAHGVVACAGLERKEEELSANSAVSADLACRALRMSSVAMAQLIQQLCEREKKIAELQKRIADADSTLAPTPPLLTMQSWRKLLESTVSARREMSLKGVPMEMGGAISVDDYFSTVCLHPKTRTAMHRSLFELALTPTAFVRYWTSGADSGAPRAAHVSVESASTSSDRGTAGRTYAFEQVVAGSNTSASAMHQVPLAGAVGSGASTPSSTLHEVLMDEVESEAHYKRRPMLVQDGCHRNHHRRGSKAYCKHFLENQKTNKKAARSTSHITFQPKKTLELFHVVSRV